MRSIASIKNKSYKNSPKSNLWFSRVFLVVGVVLFSFGAKEFVKARESVDWLNVPGKIISSTLDVHRSVGTSSNTTYEAEVLYEYEVDGVVYNNNNVAYGFYSSSSPANPRKIVNRYPKDKQVVVYFKPDKPEESVLETGIQMQTLFTPILGALFIFVGLWWAKVSKRQIAEQENNCEDINV
ncbi:MAG: DUF3592 domain-containing protein [Alphaproteobacteria bacterium]